ncbi:AFR149W-Ap [Eremothecium gossypii ATCC 10895]|uniref:AFR149W-Ap n=1 Tax=Eremothecium gossypii (strain ATCC 10895 / CBS 109.51 / FGSC 9923 / NRRL Y-1056) TaxID=284811 RepID=D8FGE0_EREGS|nr:AFR149W-Ap [Eremothecium gossypii ATCC 10895]ADJ41789.1 AFR149W-Ap [Eremothecium gossypii ATCC 10895]AEY97833.1 FAFR149W-Ap [Eremothecium gossypii FDAG1]
MSKRSPNTPISGLQKKLKMSPPPSAALAGSSSAEKFRRQLLVMGFELQRVRELNQFLEWERQMQVE